MSAYRADANASGMISPECKDLPRSPERTAGGIVRMTALATLVISLLPAGRALAQQPSVATESAPLDVPVLADRTAGVALEVRGFRVTGVAEHPRQHIGQASVQAVADAFFAQAAEGNASTRMNFAQLQAAADAVTEAYRKAGFLVSVAYLPPQSLGADQTVEIRVMEGRVGKVIVQGNQRYQSRTVGDAAERLQGKPLRKSDIESALLYARDLPGVSVSSVLQPGENEGETDVVLVANETGRPWAVNVSVDNYGTEMSGRGRAQVGLSWNNLLGRGDVLAASGNYQFSPAASRNGALSYSIPLRGVSGLSVLAGANQSELEINSGPLALLELKGPSSQQYLGADWKFINTQVVQMTASARLIHERSRFEAIGMRLSDHRYDVLDLGVGVRQTDARWRGVNLAQLSVRQSLRDNSASMDVVNPYRDSEFTIARLGLMRMQYLSKSQRVLARLNGQYTTNALPAMEQFQLGGYDSVRAYAQGEALGDRGYLVGLEYQVDAPGFGDKVSPFQGAPWREVLTFDVFADRGEVFDSAGRTPKTTLSSVGGGVTLRMQRFHNLEFRVAGAVPTSSADANDGRSTRAYARVSMTF